MLGAMGFQSRIKIIQIIRNLNLNNLNINENINKIIDFDLDLFDNIVTEYNNDLVTVYTISQKKYNTVETFKNKF